MSGRGRPFGLGASTRPHPERCHDGQNHRIAFPEAALATLVSLLVVGGALGGFRLGRHGKSGTPAAVYSGPSLQPYSMPSPARPDGCGRLTPNPAYASKLPTPRGDA